MAGPSKCNRNQLPEYSSIELNRSGIALTEAHGLHRQLTWLNAPEPSCCGRGRAGFVGSHEAPKPLGLRSGLRTGSPCLPCRPGWAKRWCHQGGLASLATSGRLRAGPKIRPDKTAKPREQHRLRRWTWTVRACLCARVCEGVLEPLAWSCLGRTRRGESTWFSSVVLCSRTS
jgi:hypothetical protein